MQERDSDPTDAIMDIDEEPHEGDIHLRDKYQFELKSEYTPAPNRTNTHSSEFFIFIPSALRINRNTYSKENFYHDQTNLIRFKTPQLPLAELIRSNIPLSPLSHIRSLYAEKKPPKNKDVLKELKIYANIVRSRVRDRVNQLIEHLHNLRDSASFSAVENNILALCEQVISLRKQFLEFLENHHPHFNQSRLKDYASYIDEFNSNTSEYFFTLLLREMTALQLNDKLQRAEQKLKEHIFWEQRHRQEAEEYSPYAQDPERSKEYFLYRLSLLKKFVWEALFLDVTRFKAARPFMQFTAAFAAALAMLIYVYFLTWQGVGFIMDSTAFIILSVGLYVIKDRIKDGIKDWSATAASRWFPDYKTRIRTPDKEAVIGYMTEYVSFLSKKQIPKELLDIRNTRFHTELERARRIEEVLYFKKQVTLYPGKTWAHGLLTELNDIFRYNISLFLTKASNAYEEQDRLDPESGALHKIKAPKVYHVNIIMRNSYEDRTGTPHTELRKFRLVLDKEGIKRIEKVI